jgi:hypothetical protein
MSAWKIMELSADETDEEIAYIDENGRIMGVGAKDVKKFLVLHGWPKVDPAHAYAMLSRVWAVEVDPHTKLTNPQV